MNVMRIAASCTELTTIELPNAVYLSDASVGELVTSCPKLTSIAVDGAPCCGAQGLDMLAAIAPQIMSLSIKGWTSSETSLWFLPQCCLLTRLNLSGISYGLTDNHIVEVADNCTRLNSV